jgi:hypothetical protein
MTFCYLTNFLIFRSEVIVAIKMLTPSFGGASISTTIKFGPLENQDGNAQKYSLFKQDLHMDISGYDLGKSKVR